MTPCEKTQQVHRSDQLLLPRTNAKSFVGQSFARPLCPPASNDPWEQGLTHTHTHYGRWSKPTLCVELSFELCANFGSRPYHCRVDLGKNGKIRQNSFQVARAKDEPCMLGKAEFILRLAYTFLTYFSPSRNSRLTTRALAPSPAKRSKPTNEG